VHGVMIVLLGMPGCGKSTLARSLAAESGQPWYDTDARLQDRFGDILGPRPGPEDWRRYRELEHGLIRELAQKSDGCLSLGGGSWQVTETRQLLLSRHNCVYLRCDPGVLSKRLAGGKRVMFADGNITQLLSALLREREPDYLLAHHTVDVSNRSEKDLLATLRALAVAPAFVQRSEANAF
jgi:shikimate kinase